MHRSRVPASPAFEAIAQGAHFRDLIAVAAKASPEAIFQALREVTLRDMKLAWLLHRPGEHWPVLEHAARALSPIAERKFARYWRIIEPLGAFVTWQLLRAVRRRAERATAGVSRSRLPWRSLGATARERTRTLPGDERIPAALDTLTHAVTIRRPPHDVWPWLAQMGAGSRAGWYSYDWLDNGRQPSATRIVRELQHPVVGTIFPAMPGVNEGFTLLAIDPERVLTLGWLAPDGTPEVTWTFVLDEVAPGVTRLVVRARGGPGYRFHGLPLLLTRVAVRIVHFIMQRKQLVGIARRAEGQPASSPSVAVSRPSATCLPTTSFDVTSSAAPAASITGARRSSISGAIFGTR